MIMAGLARTIFKPAVLHRLGSAALLSICFGVMSSHALSVFGLGDEEPPTKSADLYYGEALYEFHQNEFFDALTRLQVAKSKGGIEGHGDYPLLLEGGLMLSFGMVAEAQAHFESLLDETSTRLVSEEARNSAWFYLAKVHYLNSNFEAAGAARDKVDLDMLYQQDKSLYNEALYIQGQLLVESGDFEQDSLRDYLRVFEKNFLADSLWIVYVRYNLALAKLAANSPVETVSSDLETILLELTKHVRSENELKEAEALADRIRISLAQLYLQEQKYLEAYAHLQAVHLEGPFTDEALFLFATASAHLEQYSSSLKALEQLESRQLFSPWLKQVPYAKGYLLEQMGQIIPAVYRKTSR